MSTKLKIIGMGLLALMATGAFAVMNATAETGGHFVSEQSHTVISGSENATHRVGFTLPGTNRIICTTTTYSGTTDSTTETEITIEPHYTGCETDDGSPNPGEVTVTMNGCDFVFTIGKNSTADNTVHLTCEVGEGPVQIHHPSCTINIPAQTPSGGVAYTTDTTPGGKHSITADITVTGITSHFESGICIFTGTDHTASMSGSATISGTTAGGAEVGITATGSEG